MPQKTKLIAIVGPTASGKTSLSIELARKYHGEIVSADSRQIYRGMDIGTAKPEADTENGETRNEKGLPMLHAPFSILHSQGIPHFLVDIKNPDEDYTVAEYQRDAMAAIDGILRRGKLPILIGGTGLYMRAVLENLDIPKIKADPELRAQIEHEIKEKGLAAVFKSLVERDPEAAYIVDPKNPRRVVRALEVAIATGEPFTAQRKKQEPLYDALKIGLNPPPEVLRERINLRIDLMMQDGLVAEVEGLAKKYGTWDMGHGTWKLPSALDAIGYREIIKYLENKISLETAVEEMKLNTWHYAKRQLTWFRRDAGIHWIENATEADRLVGEFLASIKEK
ncbi:MAG: tRNA (adenosine(37)-N6)-dimethylallyltransferase MiaA [Patescibacteria group bacterium]|nr:tRNA (adenosine(37)-N6)-dimethylallyltransferase MiaA [Patescibacteria group bacterium]